MAAATTLTWRSHEVSASLPSVFVSDVTLERADRQIQLPDLPPAPEGKALTLLQVAAQIEHALMVQYLYAGYSLPEDSGPRRLILDVAIEEMSHLMTVQNLLRFIGQPPHLLRQDFEPPLNDDELLFPFALRLEPISHLSLAKYVVAESPGQIPAGVDPAVFARIVRLATGPDRRPVNRVGTLYALLAAVFGSEQLLAELAEDGDPWFVAVNQLAAEAADYYGGRAALHLPDTAFRPQSVEDQGSDTDWDRSVVNAGLDEFRVHVIGGREEALEALRDIGLQGEGPSPLPTETAHFRRFYDLFIDFFGADGTGTNPPPGVMRVPAGSRIMLDPDASGDDVISNPKTIRWARLADLRYAILLGSLQRYLSAASDDRAFLRGWCFAEMFAVKRLASILPAMPRNTADATELAAIPFNPPAWPSTGARWADLIAAFDESMAIAHSLRDEDGIDPEHRQLLDHLLFSDERKRREAEARDEGVTQRSRTDEVRDVLDWAAGAGNPTFGHGNNGRFWNLPHDQFVEAKIGNKSITNPPGGGGDALLIARLKTDMPKDRPKLEQTGEEFKLVKKWIDDGCPD